MMSAKNLRDSILQMAVEGKLVEQREEEGTAADLLAFIREQRAQLVREKKAKPVKCGESVIWRDDDGHWFERRSKGEAVCIDDEIPFDIPDSWCWARLGSIVNVVSARRVHKADWRSHGIPFYRAREIVKLSAGLPITDALYIDASLYEKLSQSGAPQPGDLMVTGVGTIGTSYVVQQGDLFYYKDASVLCLENRCDFESSYLQLLMRSSMIGEQIRFLSAGTTVDTLTIRNATMLLVPVAPAAEQIRIVEKMNKLTPYVDEYGRANKQREQLNQVLPIKLRKSILQAAVEGKLTEQSDDDEPASVLLAGIREKRAQLVREGKAKPVKGGESIIYRDDAGHWFERRGKSDPVCIDEEIPFDIPDSWCWARLGDLIDLRSGIDLDKKLYSDTERIGIPYITGASNLQNGQVLENRWTDSPRRKSMKGDLLLTCKGTIGEMAYNPFPVAHIARQIMAIKAIDDRMLEYIRLFLLFYVDKVKKAAKGVIPGIERADITGALIPIPALAEQCRIVEKVDAALQQANMHL
ncbi:restriction endonuclease subunit S [Bifidobacterium pseudolongum]|uniref:restriction endonuclease subunit S n=1 Tax=Bifidobacterium pseudolongum TaxID=1694 RepID=UPI0010211CAF|nr:restriction endonuclease subunit S [Bifidobacterium pseudolongum]RYQ32378.1 Type I restriction modification DNA specificity domain-containing protein [Bifidobacterium pseudolongum subsp. globosum]